ncbi:hypothetical protein ASC95_25945 [Pelomonas sp. Root1217]|nr:hypothetical protein ASC95_25945 [Pelomonas sp. Root1217]
MPGGRWIGIPQSLRRRVIAAEPAVSALERCHDEFVPSSLGNEGTMSKDCSRQLPTHFSGFAVCRSDQFTQFGVQRIKRLAARQRLGP